MMINLKYRIVFFELKRIFISINSPLLPNNLLEVIEQVRAC